jgi:hypothetical protein
MGITDRTRWTGYVARMGKMRDLYLGVTGKTSKRSLRNRMCGCGLDSSGSGWCPAASSYEHGNESWGVSTKGGKFLDHLGNNQLLQKDSAQLTYLIDLLPSPAFTIFELLPRGRRARR